MITEHFKKRLKERFGYEIETLINDFKEFEIVDKTSSSLGNFPFLKKKFEKYPENELIISQKLNMVIVSNNQKLITCYPL